MENSIFMLTTIDNPYDPFNNFDQWMAFDIQKGYYTCSYLDRVVESFDLGFNNLSEQEQRDVINMAIDQIVADPIGIYKRVERTN